MGTKSPFMVLVMFVLGSTSLASAQVDRWPIFVNASENETHSSTTHLLAANPENKEIHEIEVFHHRLFLTLLEDGYVVFQGSTYFIVPETFDSKVLASVLDVTDAHLVSLTPRFEFDNVLDFYQNLSQEKKAQMAHLIITVPSFEQMKYCPYIFHIGCGAKTKLVLGKLPFRLESHDFKNFLGTTKNIPTFEITCDKARTLSRIIGKHLFCGRGAIIGNFFNTLDASLNIDGQWCIAEDLKVHED